MSTKRQKAAKVARPQKKKSQSKRIQELEAQVSALTEIVTETHNLKKIDFLLGRLMTALMRKKVVRGEDLGIVGRGGGLVDASGVPLPASSSTRSQDAKPASKGSRLVVPGR